MLKNKNAIITGANGGIGRAIVTCYAQNHADIWVCVRKQEVFFEDFLSELSDKYNVSIKPIYFDLNDRDSIQKGLEVIKEERKTIDILVNNAAISSSSLFMTTTVDEIEKIFTINYFSQLYIIQKISRLMIRKRSGSIINILSTRGIEPALGLLSYGSSKAAFAFSTRILAKELGPYNIRVNAIAPGQIETRMFDENYSEEAKTEIVLSNPLRRIGMPNDIADLALFLASSSSSYINGQIIRVDGGQ